MTVVVPTHTTLGTDLASLRKGPLPIRTRGRFGSSTLSHAAGLRGPLTRPWTSPLTQRESRIPSQRDYIGSLSRRGVSTTPPREKESVRSPLDR